MQNSKKIFILDNDKNYISPLIKGFQEAGFQTICWDENQNALDAVKEITPDLIISEVDLSQIDSHDFFKELRSIPEYKSTPFIFLSNQKKVDDRIKNIEVGIDDYITKPFYVEEVVSRVKNLLKEVENLQDEQIETERGFSGNLAEMNLVDLIQTLELGKKSAIIKLEHQSSTGAVYIANGEVVDANLAGLTPVKAIMRMFTWTIGSFLVDITSSVNPEKKITKSNKELIDIGIRRINDWEQIRQGLPPLNAMVIKSSNNDYQNLNEEEREIISSLENKIRLCDLIEKSRFDDLKALEIVRGLHQKGYLKETEDNYSHYVEDYLTRIKQTGSTWQSPSERAATIVTSLFKKAEGHSKFTDRRKTDRRQLTDRRRHGRRRVDRLQQDNPIYLSKIELLMLKEALS